jgi:hypothetical protein
MSDPDTIAELIAAEITRAYHEHVAEEAAGALMAEDLEEDPDCE